MSNYAKAFKELIKQGTALNDLANANRMALQAERITMDEYIEAANILVKEFLKH